MEKIIKNEYLNYLNTLDSFTKNYVLSYLEQNKIEDLILPNKYLTYIQFKKQYLIDESFISLN